jgi:hypothetical protein
LPGNDTEGNVMPAAITAVRPLILDTGQGRTFLFVLVDTTAGVTESAKAARMTRMAVGPTYASWRRIRRPELLI